MTNLVQLQDKVTAMFDGERKRRETAIKFLNELEEILLPVAETLWGNGTHPEIEGTCWIKNKNKDSESTYNTDFYFRFSRYEGNSRDEEIGIYYLDRMYNEPLWGTEIRDLKGSDFWNIIRIIINWIPILVETIDKRNDSRDKLVALINV